MIAALLEIVVSFLIEFVFEAVVEVLAELGFNSLVRAGNSRIAGPVVRTLLYSVIGVCLGLASVYVFPVHAIESEAVRIVLMALSAISMGLMLCLVSWFIYRKDRHEPFWSLQKFVTGVAFSLSYSLCRGFFIDIL